MPAESNVYFPFFKASARLGVDGGRLWLESLRRLRELQLKTGSGAIETLQGAATALDNSDDLAALLSQQTRLQCDQFERSMQYWRDLLGLAKDNQTAIAKACQQAMDSWMTGCSDAFDQIVKAQPTTAPIETWLNGMSNAAALTIDAMTATTQGLNEWTKASVPPGTPAKSSPAASASKHH